MVVWGRTKAEGAGSLVWAEEDGGLVFDWDVDSDAFFAI